MANRAFGTLVAAACVFALSGRVAAQCTSRTDANTVLKSVKQAVKCNDKRLRRGPGEACILTAPPACAGTLVNDAVALAYGGNNYYGGENPAPVGVDTGAVRDQLRCQKIIGKAIANFVGKRLAYLTRGLSASDATARARRLLDKLPDDCAVTVAQDPSSIVLPDVGKQCDAAVGAPGSTVDASSLRDALVTLLGTWVDRVGPNPAPLRPNVVLILTDDQRFDTIGLAHSIDGVTPVMPNVMNELVNHGVTFTNSYATTALCAPSRSSLLSAKYSHTTGVHDNGGVDGGFGAFNDASTLAVWLKAAGYHTGIYGKYINGYGPSAPYQAPGWDEWHVFKNVAYFNYTLVENGAEIAFGSADTDYSTDVLRDRVVQFINDSAGPTPFFLYFVPKAPHGPATPAPRHAGSFSGIPPWRPPNYNEADVSDKPAWLQAIVPWDAPTMATHDAFNQRQLECLQAVDEAVEAVMQALRDTGVDQNTIVIFASDNGYSWGSHRWEPKQCPYEECMRVPLVIRYSALAPLPRVESGFGLNIDHGETIAELAGATADAGVEGRSMVRLLDGTEPAWRSDFLEEHWNGKITTLAQVRGMPWKYTEYVTMESELYDETADPFELTNVVTDPANASVVSDLAARLRVLRPGWPAP
jgi:arylsulfatase A-like enzyme